MRSLKNELNLCLLRKVGVRTPKEPKLVAFSEFRDCHYSNAGTKTGGFLLESSYTHQKRFFDILMEDIIKVVVTEKRMNFEMKQFYLDVMESLH